MARKIYRTAQGKVIDFDALYATNEETIALGNMKVNARGDELGPGGKIVKTRAQVMEEYYKLNTPTAGDAPIPQDRPMSSARVEEAPVPQIHPDHIGEDKMSAEELAQMAEFDDPDAPALEKPAEETKPVKPEGAAKGPIRGSLASSVAATTTVTQELQKPLNKRNGVQRF